MKLIHHANNRNEELVDHGIFTSNNGTKYCERYLRIQNIMEQGYDQTHGLEVLDAW